MFSPRYIGPSAEFNARNDVHQVDAAADQTLGNLRLCFVVMIILREEYNAEECCTYSCTLQ